MMESLESLGKRQGPGIRLTQPEDTTQGQEIWISVKDGLPEDDIDVLVFRKYLETEDTEQLVTYHDKDGWDLVDWGCADRSFKVTHWMPLPKGPA